MATKQLTTEEQISYTTTELLHQDTEQKVVRGKIEALEQVRKSVAKQIKELKLEDERLGNLIIQCHHEIRELGGYDGLPF